MGAAEADETVHPADPEETIDGAEPRAEPRSLPAPVLGALRDFSELVEVDRSRFVITRELAKGGMGRVLEARDLRLGRLVAIKELLPKNRDIAKRFEREARITARLQHPSIIHVYEAGVWPGGEPFYAMPLVDGRSLDKVVAERKTLRERLALLPRVIAVADALAYAHANHVIHRDLKPGNVLVGQYGETVVIDWGLAKDLAAHGDPKESMRLQVRALPEETASGSVVGTPAYMSPEQARGEALDQRADVYALGALLYKVLSGRAPYKGELATEVVEKVKAGPPTPIGLLVPDAPPELVAIVGKAMARAAADRYASASELAQDLQRFETGQLVGAHRYTTGELVGRWLHRYRVVVGVSTVALAVLVVVGALSLQSVLDARDRAEARRTALLDERGRSELRLGHAGIALAYLVEAARDGRSSRQFLIAEALRPFEAQKAVLTHADGGAIVAASPDGRYVVTAAGRRAEVWTPDGGRVRVLGDIAATNVIAFDTGGTRVAFGGDDGIVRLWKLDGTPVMQLDTKSGALRAMDFAPDGELATVGADGLAKVWNLWTGSEYTPDCASGAMTTVKFSPLGLLAAAGDEDGSTCVWSVWGAPKEQPRIVAMLRRHTAAVTAIRWSDDLTWLATASADGTAGVWSPYFGKLIVEPLHHGRPVTALEIVGDRTLMTGDDEGGLHLWTIPRKRPFGEDGTVRVPIEADMPLAGHAGTIVAFARSPDGHTVATAGADRVAKLWSATTGQPIATFEQADALTSIAFAGGTLVTGSRDGTSRLWDTTAVAPREWPIDSAVLALAISRSGAVAARADSKISLVPGDPDKDVLEKHMSSVNAVAFTPDGSYLISAGVDDSPIVWDMATRTPVEGFPAEGPFTAVAAAPDNDRFATAGEKGVWQWSRTTKSARRLDEAPATALAYAPHGDLLVSGGAEQLHAWLAGTPASAITLRHAIRSLAFSADGRWLAIGGPHALEIRAVTDGRIADRAAMTVDGSPGDVRALVFACDGTCLVSGNDAGLAEVWDTATGRLLATRDPHAGAISGLALSGETLWIATEGKVVGAWPLRVETRGRAELECFIAEHVPWRLGADDVVSRSEGGSDEQRRSHCK